MRYHDVLTATKALLRTPTVFYYVHTDLLLAIVCALVALALRSLHFHDAHTALTAC
jgi:hypothetical protein